MHLDVYDRCMDIVVSETQINELVLCQWTGICFANGRVSEGRCFWHLLSMDGTSLEIAATFMCPLCHTIECQVC